MIHLDDYLVVVKAEEIKAIKQLGARLAGRTVQHINSTAVGGGVA
ncbi:MAG TPA: glycosyl transferase family 1, partial [Desulfotomaculum sp.]|nr:glycosyl transferase family 1 [Desulfotomaculum sp.]